MITMLPSSLNQQTTYKSLRSVSPLIRDRVEDVDSIIGDAEYDDEDNIDIGDHAMNNETNMQNTPHARMQTSTYNYRALESLNKNMGEITDVDYLVVFLYSVNTEGAAPFLQFGLINDGLSLNFITMRWTEMSFDLDKLENLRGHIVQDRTLYLFSEYCSDNENLFLSIFPANTFVLADEIINHRMVYRKAISINVLDFFARNEQFLYLDNDLGKVYEIPVAVYRGTYAENRIFMSMFGVAVSQCDAVMGPYYYFTDYINAMKQAVIPTAHHLTNQYLKKYLTADNKYKDGAVLRFALFLGAMNVVLNRPSDTIDESQVKQHLLSNPETSTMARLTMRMSDHDGIWTNTYDSVYIGKIDLDDGSKYMNAPLWIVKKYNQQVFLSCNMIDRERSLYL